MKRMLRKLSPFIMSAVMVCYMMWAALPVSAANYEIPGTCQVQTDTGISRRVKTLDYSYENNTYLSLRDMAVALKGTDKAFSLEIKKSAVSLNIGGEYAPVGTEEFFWENSENPDITLRRNEFKVNGQDVYYYTMITKLPSGYYDCFMMAADLAMILDTDIHVSEEGSVEINTGEPFSVSPAELEQDGYFYGVNSVLVGDAGTGEIYYRYQSDEAYPIASTTKLMTCLLTLEAISEGRLAPEEQVTVSEAAQTLAASSDGVLPLEAGQRITVRELLLGALLPSSNECALCLAERIDGSEEAFVERMNQKALDLGLSQAIFFNSHGLPYYTEEAVPAKCQNRMSAEDMFRLVSYLLKVYPQITDMTSLKSATLESLGREVRNTNPLLYNLPGVTGLKTGTTNKAGACLITSLPVDDGVMEHDLVVIVLGTEDSIERGRVSGLLARYAMQAFATGTEGVMDGEQSETGEALQTPGKLPVNAEAAVDCILRTAKKR
ncbi:MAG: D-alanyl-D-alanine carboxypeptidase [Butyrivibrio sp.]|nr:D-alanyl-D-alanine carboxypeptidase [Acetatifactor muris]MCM1561044.1 D-alanyl-D-alanine carboxypeptidase [Butyrivibrio sp.]